MTRDQRLDEFLEAVPVACHEINVAGEIVFVNAAECRLLGLTRHQMLGRLIWDFVAPEEQTSSREAVRRKMVTAKPSDPASCSSIRSASLSAGPRGASTVMRQPATVTEAPRMRSITRSGSEARTSPSPSICMDG